MKKTIYCILVCVILIILGCSKSETIIEEPKERGGTLTFVSGANFEGKTIPVHYFIPKGDTKDMEFQIVLHGAERNGREYLAAWAQKSREYGIISIAPEFSDAQFNSGQYNEGNAVTGSALTATDKMTFALIDQIFEFVKSELKVTNTSYNIYGHSAGAQFVHRYLQFYPNSKVKKSIAANAGWYTFPDETISYPYGIRSLTTDPKSLRQKSFEKELIVLLGSADTLRTGDLRIAVEADRQGRNRLERGNGYFNYCKNKATTESLGFNWKIETVQGVGHDHVAMSARAADLLYK